MDAEKFKTLGPKESRHLAAVAGVLFILLAIAAAALMYKTLPSPIGDVAGW